MTVTIIPNCLAGVDIPQIYNVVRKNERNLFRSNPNLSEIILEIGTCAPHGFESMSAEHSTFSLSEDDKTLRLCIVCPELSNADQVCQQVSVQIEAVQQAAWAWAWAIPKKQKTTH